MFDFRVEAKVSEKLHGSVNVAVCARWHGGRSDLRVATHHVPAFMWNNFIRPMWEGGCERLHVHFYVTEARRGAA